MKKILVFEKRKKARELRSKGWSIRKIAQALIASKNSVNKWIKMTEEEIVSDGRGWERGKLKEHTEIEKKRIIDIRRQLEKECSYFIGELIVKKNYENLYGEPIERWFIKKVLKDSDLVKKKSIKKRDGRSKYMKYPDYTINKLGKIFMSMDFIGPKYLKGGEKRINFLSCKYIRPNKLGIMERTDGQTTEEVIRILSKLWINNPIPDVLKVDNDSAFGTNTLHKNALGRLTIFLLNIGVSPLYVAPRSPWNNGEVEGFNSVFSKKFWDKIRFEDEKEIDVKIKDFNLEYEKYSDLIVNNPEIKEPRYIEKYKDTDFTSRTLFFIR